MPNRISSKNFNEKGAQRPVGVGWSTFFRQLYPILPAARPLRGARYEMSLKKPVAFVSNGNMDQAKTGSRPQTETQHGQSAFSSALSCTPVFSV